MNTLYVVLIFIELNYNIWSEDEVKKILCIIMITVFIHDIEIFIYNLIIAMNIFLPHKVIGFTSTKAFVGSYFWQYVRLR